MGRGSSGISGAGGKSGAGGAKSASGKPFDANDWRTWPVGTEVQLKSDDIAVGDVGGSKTTKTVPGVVAEVYPDHIIIIDTKTNTRNWINSDTVDIVKSVKKK